MVYADDIIYPMILAAGKIHRNRLFEVCYKATEINPELKAVFKFRSPDRSDVIDQALSNLLASGLIYFRSNVINTYFAD